MANFDFYAQFREYPTAELLKIIREKGNYQVEAILAVEMVLQEREISSVDEEEADRYFREEEGKRIAAAAKIDSYKAVVMDWVEPVARPSAELQPYKWYRIFLVVYGISCAWILYQFILHLFTTRSISLNLENLIVEAAGLVWAILLFVLIFKKHRWGWILMIVGNAPLVLMQLMAFIAGLGYSRIGVDSTPSLYLAIFHLAIVVFLWRKPMAEFFGVEPVVKSRALGVGVGIGVIFDLVALHSIW